VSPAPLDLDVRRGAFNLTGSAGVDETFDIVWPAGTPLVTVRVLTGGTLEDSWADTTGTTAVTATIDDTTATVTLPVPTAAQRRTPIRLEVNGAIIAAGYLTPSVLGTGQTGQTLTIRDGNATITITPRAVGGRVDTIGEGTYVAVDATDPTAPVVDLTAEAVDALEAAGSAVQPAALTAAVEELEGTIAPVAEAAASALQPEDVGVVVATAAEGDLAGTAVQPADLRTPAVGRGVKPYTGAAGLISYDVDPVGQLRRKCAHVENFLTPNGGTAGWDGTIPASFADLAALRAYLVLAKNHKVGEPAWDVITSNGGNVKNAGNGQTGGVSLATGTSSAAGACAIELPSILVADIGSANGAIWAFTASRGAASAAQAFRGEVGLRVGSAATAHAIGVRATCGNSTTVVAFAHNGTTETTVALPTMAQDTLTHFAFVFRASQTWDVYRNGELVHTFASPTAPFLSILRPYALIAKTAGTGTERGLIVDGFAYDLEQNLAA
jgi:hypothetical protein